MWRLLLVLFLVSCASSRQAALHNSLGMELVHVPAANLQVCRHETRVRDYRVFVRETRREWPRTGFHQTDTHPAVNVSWRDAQAFCEWLSAREGRRYRLPTDAEWSTLAGVRHLEPRGVSPKLQPQLPGRHPFGKRPLAAGDANLCDTAFGKSEFGEGYEARWISDCNDGYAATAPVGSFKADANGLCDLSGNVWEWCVDWYDPPKNTLKVLRGASWRTGNPERIWASYRGPDPPGCRIDSAGFRIVLEP